MNQHVDLSPFFLHLFGGGGDFRIAAHIAGKGEFPAEFFADGFDALLDRVPGIAEGKTCAFTREGG